MPTGFFVPNSVSSSYVANKRNESGALEYESAAGEVGVGKQTALQQLGKQYSSAIEGGYAAYLAANRGVMGSNMGQGFKEEYLRLQQEGMQQNIAETNLGAANARQELDIQEAQIKGQIQKQFQTEVGYMDRMANSLNDYLGYVRSLTNSKGLTYLNSDQMGKGLDQMYDILYNAQPQGYLDESGNLGMSYLQWLNAQLKETTADKEFGQWAFGLGGYNQFQEATRKGIQK